MAAIDELRKRLREMQRRLMEWNVDYERAYTRLRRQKVGRWGRPGAELEGELRDEARRAAGEELPHELFGFLDELADAYLAEPLPHNRAKLRADVGDNLAMLAALWGFAEQCVDLVRGADDEQRVLRALAALSLDDLRTNLELVDGLLARLWLAAARAGTDAQAVFERVAAVSNPGMGGGGACLAPRLRAFASSRAFQRDVAPELARRSS